MILGGGDFHHSPLDPLPYLYSLCDFIRLKFTIFVKNDFAKKFPNVMDIRVQI